MTDTLDRLRSTMDAKGFDEARYAAWLADPEIFRALIRHLADPFRGSPVTRVTATDGAVAAIAGAVASELAAGFLESVTLLEPRDQVLLVTPRLARADDLARWVEAVEASGAEIAGVAGLAAESGVSLRPDLSHLRMHWLVESNGS